MPNGIAFILFWVLVPIYAWARKLIVAFLWKRRAGGHEGAPPWRQLPAKYGQGNSVYRR